MDCAPKLRDSRIARPQNRSRGYILLTLMLFLSLLAIAALAILPDVVNQVKRDREEEMIHRGVGYSRAIRRFYKKFGRYPTKVEDLENTNQMRFIRKRYKDPVNNEQSFRILRPGDPALVGLQMTRLIPGATPGPGSSPTQPAGQQTQVTNTGTTNASDDTGN